MVLEMIFKFRHVFWLFRYCFPLKKIVALNLTKLQFHSLKDTLYQDLLEFAQSFHRFYFLNFIDILPLFSLSSALGKISGPSFEHTLIPITTEWFVSSLPKELAKWFLRRLFLCFGNIFQLVRFYLPRKRKKWYFFWTKMNSSHPRLICPRFGWIWFSGSGEDLKR